MGSKGVLPYNPVDNAEPFHIEAKERRPFTREELAKLYPADLERALEIWGSPLCLAWGLALRDTGCRPSEALAWTWEDYYETQGGFVITKRMREGAVMEGTKGGKRRHRGAVLSEMGNQVIRMLREKAETETERVFPFDVQRGLGYFRSALVRAGVAEDGRTQYCLRHTAAAQTIDIDREFAREAFGHAAVTVREGYDHPDRDELFQRTDEAPDILKKRMGQDLPAEPDASQNEQAVPSPSLEVY